MKNVSDINLLCSHPLSRFVFGDPMKYFVRKLLLIPALLALAALSYGFVHLVDMMKIFTSDLWAISIFSLCLLAVVPLVIFMVAQDELDEPNEEDEQNDDEDEHRLD